MEAACDSAPFDCAAFSTGGQLVPANYFSPDLPSMLSANVSSDVYLRRSLPQPPQAPWPFVITAGWHPITMPPEATGWNLAQPLIAWNFLNSLYLLVSLDDGTSWIYIGNGLSGSNLKPSWLMYPCSAPCLPRDPIGYTNIADCSAIDDIMSVCVVSLSTGALWRMLYPEFSWNRVALEPSIAPRPTAALFGSWSDINDFVSSAFAVYDEEKSWVYLYRSGSWASFEFPGDGVSARTLLFGEWMVNGQWAWWKAMAMSPSDGRLHLFCSSSATLDTAAWYDAGPLQGGGLDGSSFYFFLSLDTDIGFSFNQEGKTRYLMAISNGSAFSLSRQSGPPFVAPSGLAFSSGEAPIDDGNYVIINATSVSPPERSSFSVVVGPSAGYFLQWNIQGVVLAGGADLGTGAYLADAYFLLMRATCFEGMTNPPLCQACPPCGNGVCDPSATIYASEYLCICDKGWDAAVGCTACIAGIDCDPASSAALYELHKVLIGVVVGGAILLPLIVGAVLFCRYRGRVQRAKKSSSYDVFLSYDWNRGAAASLQVMETLFATGVRRVWRDTKDMRQDLLLSMVDGVRASRCAILVVSRDYVKSANCRLEATEILRCAETRGMEFLVVTVDGYNPLTDPVDQHQQQIGEQHPIRLLLYLAPHAQVPYDDTFGSADWRNAQQQTPSALLGAQRARGTSTSPQSAASAPLPASGAVAAALAPSTSAASPAVTGIPSNAAISSQTWLQSALDSSRAQILVLYIREHVDRVQEFCALLRARGFSLDLWPLPASGEAPMSVAQELRLCSAARGAEAVMLCLGARFATALSSNMRDALRARKLMGTCNLFLVPESGYMPGRGSPGESEDDVALLASDLIYVNVSAAEQGSAATMAGTDARDWWGAKVSTIVGHLEESGVQAANQPALPIPASSRPPALASRYCRLACCRRTWPCILLLFFPLASAAATALPNATWPFYYSLSWTPVDVPGRVNQSSLVRPIDFFSFGGSGYNSIAGLMVATQSPQAPAFTLYACEVHSPAPVTWTPLKSFDPLPYSPPPFAYTNAVAWFPRNVAYTPMSGGIYIAGIGNGHLYRYDNTYNTLGWRLMCVGPWKDVPLQSDTTSPRLYSYAPFGIELDDHTYSCGTWLDCSALLYVDGPTVWFSFATSFCSWRQATLPGASSATPQINVALWDGGNSSAALQYYIFIHTLSEVDNAWHMYLAECCEWDTVLWVDNGPMAGPFFGDNVVFGPSVYLKNGINGLVGWQYFWLSTDGSTASLSPLQYEALLNKSSASGTSWHGGLESDPQRDFVVTQGQPLVLPQRSKATASSAFTYDGRNNGLPGFLVGGGTSVGSSPSFLTDIWYLRVTATCYGGNLSPPACDLLCPDCGSHGFCDSAAIYEEGSCSCDTGYDTLTQCSSCLPNFPCLAAPSFSAATIVYATVIPAIVAGIISCYLCCRWRRQRRRILEHVVNYDIFVANAESAIGDAAPALVNGSNSNASANVEKLLRQLGLRIFSQDSFAATTSTSGSFAEALCKLAPNPLASSKSAILFLGRDCAQSHQTFLDAKLILSSYKPFVALFHMEGHSTRDAVLASLLPSHPVAQLYQRNPASFFRYEDAERHLMEDAALRDPVALSANPSPLLLALSPSRSIFLEVTAQIQCVYFEEYVAQFDALRKGFLAAGFNSVNGWPHPPCDYSGSTALSRHLDALPSVMRSYVCVVYFLGHDFPIRCSRAFFEARARERRSIEQNNNNMALQDASCNFFVVADGDFRVVDDPKVSALVGRRPALDISRTAVGSSKKWLEHAQEIHRWIQQAASPVAVQINNPVSASTANASATPSHPLHGVTAVNNILANMRQQRVQNMSTTTTVANPLTQAQVPLLHGNSSP